MSKRSFPLRIFAFLLLALTVEIVSGSFFRKRRHQAALLTPATSIDHIPHSGTEAIDSLPFDHIDSITRRLEIYIRANDPSALFCELKANRLTVATVQVFDRIVTVLVEMLRLPPDHEILQNRSAGILVSSVINAFIHFKVNVLQAPALKNRSVLNFFVFKFSTVSRIPLAFFILFSDFNLVRLFQHVHQENFNFYAVDKAILMLNDSIARMNVLNQFYDNFGADLLDSFSIPRRLFRDSPDSNLCNFIVNRGFNPSAHPSIYSKCHLPLHHPKWDYFSEIYGHDKIEDFLQSGRLIIPQTIKFKFPFEICPLKELNHPRWNIYAKAFGNDIVGSFKLRLMED